MTAKCRYRYRASVWLRGIDWCECGWLTGYKPAELSEEQLQKRQLKAKQRREQAARKQEKDKVSARRTAASASPPAPCSKTPFKYAICNRKKANIIFVLQRNSTCQRYRVRLQVL